MCKTLNKALSVKFIKSVLSLFVLFSGVILIIDSVEVFRSEMISRTGIIHSIFFILGKNYKNLQLVLPIIFLISSAIYFQEMNKNFEIIALKSLGICNFRILLPIITITILFSIVNITIFDGIYALSVRNNSSLNSKEYVQVGENGVWFRQVLDDSLYIVNAKTIKNKTLRDIRIIEIDKAGNFLQNIDARKVILNKRNWEIFGVKRYNGLFEYSKEEKLILPFALSIEDLIKSLIPADKMNIFELSKFIFILDKLGFSNTEHIYELYKRLFLPIILSIMVLIGFNIVLNLPRAISTSKVLTYTVFFAIFMHFFNNLFFMYSYSAKFSGFISHSIYFCIIILIYIFTFRFRRY